MDYGMISDDDIQTFEGTMLRADPEVHLLKGCHLLLFEIIDSGLPTSRRLATLAAMIITAN